MAGHGAVSKDPPRCDLRLANNLVIMALLVDLCNVIRLHIHAADHLHASQSIIGNSVMASLAEPIVLRPMRHQGYIQRQKEDRAGITDPKRRKTLQNRLNQRARKQSFFVCNPRFPRS